MKNKVILILQLLFCQDLKIACILSFFIKSKFNKFKFIKA